MSHRNARTTFHGRLLIVERHQSGWKQAQIAEAMGISRKCVHTWISRYAAEGSVGLFDRSSRPHCSPRRTPAAVEQQVLAARREHRRGPDWLGPELGVPARTVGRILRRHGQPYLRDCDPMTGAVIKAAKATAVRYERDRPGELVHVDVKKLSRIPDGGGWRAHGRSEEVRGRGNGYDYVHSMVDDHSRLAYSEILPDEKGPTCAGFIERAADYFVAQGISRIERIITDNHLSYRRSAAVAAVIAQLSTRHLFIKPHCPWQNGKVERFNRTLQTEWCYRRVFTSNAERANALAPWLEFYNTQRRHSALDGLPPISRL
ncbi:IS481 family transposase [Mycobacterium paraseoulense]|uniref:IS481 family transposase n=1 Tax=Mycobacterium paraseoulense TaxID=590652 RepID=UPI0011509551|nr:IS481 family transposase [Mycobacterium paraseoulense]MCV7398036.1 IS481 family transposase [Mycobacterium paraseoulense]BBZ69044.1 IS481 family transposase [Mycobacterium paraseoulense]BBZ70210.1 IS481 family transposase [Mycobacterium paraseoulense]BBZ70225.1 IS481 family transposase [Mycobacterium paraseoulense]